MLKGRVELVHGGIGSGYPFVVEQTFVYFCEEGVLQDVVPGTRLIPTPVFLFENIGHLLFATLFYQKNHQVRVHQTTSHQQRLRIQGPHGIKLAPKTSY